MRLVLATAWLALVAACPAAHSAPPGDGAVAAATTADTAATATPGPAPPAPPAAAPRPARRWIAGDLHMHTTPPGSRRDVVLTLSQIVAAARAHGLEFVIVTPHLWESTWNVPRRRARWQAEWRAMAARARSFDGITVIPGVEWGIDGIGHFGCSGVPLDELAPGDFLSQIDERGGFVVVNHPFVVPTRNPRMRVSFRDMSYRPWTHPDRVPPRHDPIDGVEVWNVLHRSSHLVSARQEAKGFVAADQLARTQHRPIAVVGGTDNHKRAVRPTTWVLATDASEPAILAALRGGATCVGSAAAGTLEAHGDTDPPDAWAQIGDSAHAAARLELRWRGRARLFVDGVDRGLHEDTWTDDAAAGTHTYRIEVPGSQCGFVYANLTSPPNSPPAPVPR